MPARIEYTAISFLIIQELVQTGNKTMLSASDSPFCFFLTYLL